MRAVVYGRDGWGSRIAGILPAGGRVGVGLDDASPNPALTSRDLCGSI